MGAGDHRLTSRHLQHADLPIGGLVVVAQRVDLGHALMRHAKVDASGFHAADRSHQHLEEGFDL
jgi:hypothetical protein